MQGTTPTFRRDLSTYYICWIPLYEHSSYVVIIFAFEKKSITERIELVRIFDNVKTVLVC